MVMIITKRIKWNLNKTLTKYSEVVAADWVKRATQQQCQLFYCSSHSNITRAIRPWVIHTAYGQQVIPTILQQHVLMSTPSMP